jgi:hypothetical protein
MLGAVEAPAALAVQCARRHIAAAPEVLKGKELAQGFLSRGLAHR